MHATRKTETEDPSSSLAKWEHTRSMHKIEANVIVI